MGLMDFENTYEPTDDGQWVSTNHRRIAEIINDYNPDLFLAWIPPEFRIPSDGPKIPEFAILHIKSDGSSYVVMLVGEDEVDERLLARVFAGDTSKHDVLGNVETSERALEAVRLKKKMEDAEERKDVVEHILKGKTGYKHGGHRYT